MLPTQKNDHGNHRHAVVIQPQRNVMASDHEMDGGRSAPVVARRWPLCHHSAGVAWGRIDHRLGVDGDGGRSGPRFERVNRPAGPAPE